MSRILFSTLAEAVAEVKPGDDRQLLIVKFKAKEYYTLADGVEAALAAVLQHLGAEAGAVPLDLILQACREQLAPKDAIRGGEEKSPEKIRLSSLSVAELKEIHRKQIATIDGEPETAGLKRAGLVRSIARRLPDDYADDKMEGVVDDPPAAK